MKTSFPYSASDFLLVKWQLLALVVCLALLALLFWGTASLYSETRRDFQNAQSNLRSARSSLEQIEQEEATIIEYIGRYEQLSADGIVAAEDRLQFLETMAAIRARHSLFPVTISIDEQTGLRLNYAPGEPQPGGPIDLRASQISLTLPLLHEEDLTRMLGSLFATPGLFQMRECSLRQANSSRTSFINLGQHFAAQCELHQYSFNLSPAQEPAR